MGDLISLGYGYGYAMPETENKFKNMKKLFSDDAFDIEFYLEDNYPLLELVSSGDHWKGAGPLLLKIKRSGMSAYGYALEKIPDPALFTPTQDELNQLNDFYNMHHPAKGKVLEPGWFIYSSIG
jgi:hypothetical protein